MKILTTNHPIIVNGVRESKSSDYLSASGQDTPDDFFGADGLEVISSKNPIIFNGDKISNPSWYESAEGSRMSSKRASNIAQRIAKNERIKANAQKRIDAINSRVQASGKPMGRIDANIVNGLQRQIARVQAFIDKLNAMASSSADGDDYYGMDGDIYSYIDKKNTTDVKGFQTYANSKGAKLVVDGIWGAKTEAEYTKFGAEWEATKNPIPTPAVANVVANAPVVPPNTNPTANQVAEAKRKGLFWDKVKGGWVYAKESGILDWVGNLFGLQPPPAFQPTNTGGGTGGGTGGDGGKVVTDDDNKKLTKTQKTLLYVGGALVLGFVIYTIAKPKK